MLLYYIFIRYCLIGIYGPNFFPLHTCYIYLFVVTVAGIFAGTAGGGGVTATATVATVVWPLSHLYMNVQLLSIVQ